MISVTKLAAIISVLTDLVEVDIENVIGEVALPQLGGTAVPARSDGLLGVTEAACQQPSVAEHAAMIVRPRHHNLLSRAVYLISQHNNTRRQP